MAELGFGFASNNWSSFDVVPVSGSKIVFSCYRFKIKGLC